MSAQDNGGSAYPHMTMITDAGQESAETGLTIRDAIAIGALTGICANPGAWRLNDPQAAKQAYILADHMLAERGRT